jgi:hypothetical protein
MQKLRANQAYKRFASSIREEHPLQYARLKDDLYDAIGRVIVSGPPDDVATANFEEIFQRHDPPVRRKTDAGERMLRTKYRFVTDLTELVRVETLIGSPVATFLVFDNDRLARHRTQLLGTIIGKAIGRFPRLSSGTFSNHWST